jgi:signal recognition particle GTPase
MNDIVQALRTRLTGSPAIGLIVGLSGTGKTQISLKYAYDHDDEYAFLSGLFSGY